MQSLTKTLATAYASVPQDHIESRYGTRRWVMSICTPVETGWHAVEVGVPKSRVHDSERSLEIPFDKVGYQHSRGDP